MSTKEQDFKRRLLLTFRQEAQDHLKTILSGLIELEKSPAPERRAEIIETIFRATHSMKGASRAVNMQDIERICQSFESVLSAWKKKGFPLTRTIFDTVYKTADIVRALADSVDEGPAPPEKGRVSQLIDELQHIEKEGSEYATGVASITAPSPASPHTPSPSSSIETVRISTAKLGALLLEAEELLTSKLTARRLSMEAKAVNNMIRLIRKELKGTEGAVPSNKNIIDRLQAGLEAVEEHVAALAKSSARFNRSLDRMVDNLLDDMKTVMMLPFSAILEGFPLIVRDIARDEGKEVELQMRGEGIEIDRRILEEIKDPLVHLVRNSVDHGIERSLARKRNNKPQHGTIKIEVSQADGNKVEVVVSDDGAGINISKVKEMAVKDGILSQEDADARDRQELLSLIFHSGVSTSPMVTDISGRGIGLAIVREKIERLGGDISVETGSSGTAFRMTLPVTIATFRGILVRAGDQTVILPTLNVERVLRVRNEEIKTVENKETITWDGKALSFVRLNSVLELPLKKGVKGKENSTLTTVLILSTGEKRIAFGVDEMLNEKEVLVKPLGRQLARVRNVAGAAILGSGRPAPVLNVQDLIRSAVKTSFAPQVEANVEETAKKSILVAEDSITSRILLKNILEAAGYRVKTAVDGIDAITTLKTEEFDLVVSDVEMPRMDGFDLTARIRSDKKLSELPVVLVTALETREDRERGIDVGANAYIVKSSFNQGNLLEVIKKMI